MKIQFFFFIFLFHFAVAQQKSFVVSGSIKSKNGNLPIENVVISSSPGKHISFSSSDGSYSIELFDNDSTLTFSQLSFYSKTIRISKKANLLMNIELENKFFELKEVSISSKPEIVFGLQTYWVHDYEFWKNYIFLIAYKKDIDESEFLVLDSLQNLIKCVPIPDTPQEFFRDCYGEIHIVCEKSDFQVGLNEEKKPLSVLFYEYPIENFNFFLRPMIGKIEDNYYLQRYGLQNLSVVYYCFNSSNKQTKLLCSVSDENREKMFNDEDRRLQALISMQNSGMGSKAIQTLIDQAEPFAKQILYKNAVDAYLVPLKDSVYLFDFYNRRIEAYSPQGKFSRSMKADYGSYKIWKKKLLIDGARNEAYTLFNKEGYSTIKKIELSNGALSNAWTIDMQYAKNIKVNNGYIYFVYRPVESQQTKYLYKIKM